MSLQFTDMELFRAGVQTDSAGRKRTFTEAELDEIIATYNPKEHEAPAVVGHPTDTAPAYGWVRKLWRKGARLFGDVELIPEMVDAVRRGLFKKRSVSLYQPDHPQNPAPGKWSLRHVGFLGGQPPAVKGLADIAFSDDPDAHRYDFSLPTKPKEEVMKLTPKEFLKKVFGVESPPEDLVVDFGDLAAKPAAPTFSEAEVAEREKKAAAEAAKKAKEEAALEFAEQQKKAEAERMRANHKAEIGAFIDRGIETGKIAPAWKQAGLAEFMESLPSGVETVEFGESREQKRPIDWFKNFVEGLPKIIDFGEVAKRENKTGSPAAKLDAYTRETMKADKTLTYSQAFAQASAEHPDLAAEYAENLNS